MGQFIVKVDAVGGHGCQRDKGDGDVVLDCSNSNCPDCITREYVRRLRRAGTTFTEATITHWPQSEQSVQDDLLTGIRKGSF